MISFDDLESIIKGSKYVNRINDLPIRNLVLDSRSINPNSISDQDLFFAISGAHHDGHDYIEEAFNSGIRQFIVENTEGLNQFLTRSNILIVQNSTEGLQKLVAHHRSHFNIPVIGITGSNGKTVVKEWLYSLLSGRYHVVKNPGSYNSQIGVPLSVWRMSSDHEIGVFEAGISQPGEMNKLESIIRPSIGICTNIGSAHDAGFADAEEKISEKIQLFQNCETIIYRSDYEALDHALKDKTNETQELLAWSSKKDGPIRAEFEENKLNVHFNDLKCGFQIKMTGSASFENLMHCIVLLLRLGYNESEIQEGINLLASVEMRMELKRGINGCYLIDDTYNNDLDGIQIALDFMNRHRQKPDTVLIISDILQSKLSGETLYQNLSDLTLKNKVSKIVGIGPQISAHTQLFQAGSRFYPDTPSLLSELPQLAFHNQVILVKGAREYHMEDIVKALSARIHDTTLEINLGAIIHNLNTYRSKLLSETKIMVMVKAFGYGSGDFEIAHLLQFHKVDYLGVAYVEEGAALRKNGIHVPIMVMNPSAESFQKILDNDLQPEVFSLGMLRKFDNFCRQNDKILKVHLKLDTGMHRLGLNIEDLGEALDILENNSHLQVESVFTHLASAEEAGHDEFTRNQVALFDSVYEQISSTLGYSPVRHILNSSGIIRHSRFQYEMVRIGIGLYGHDPAGIISGELVPANRLTTIISQVRTINPGETVGYGRAGKADSTMTVATIAIGYADGFGRSLGNGNCRLWINEGWAPTVGNICMDMTMVDITSIDAHEGDEVEIFGAHQSIVEFAAAAQTIPYEILTSVAERVKRIYKYSS